MIIIDFKDALCLWFFLSVGVVAFEMITKGGDALIIDMVTPAYWMLCMLLVLRFND